MTFVRAEIKDFSHSKKRTSFRVVFTEEEIGNGSPLEELENEDSEEFYIVLEEKKKKFSLRDIRDSYENEIELVIEKVSGSVVLFFRLGSHDEFGERIYINIVYNWRGKWKYIRFDTADFSGIFKKKLS